MPKKIASRKLNILFCIEYLAYGGTEKQLMALVEGLNRERFIPHVCCLRSSAIGNNRITEAAELFDRLKCKKIQLDFVSLRNIGSYFELLRLVKFIKKNRIEVIQTYFQDPTLLALLAGKLCGVKHIIACFRDMAFWYQRMTDHKMRFIYRLCTHYIANSEAVRRKYMRLFGLPEDKFTVIYNGVDVRDQMLPFEHSDINSQDVVVGIIANLNRSVKRVDVFLRAAAHVMKQKSGIRFVVIGDGELKAGLISYANNLGLNKSVDFIGRVSDIRQCLSKVDIGAVSSDSEGFSNAVLEFMASGIPVVATDVGGNSEIIENGINGFLVPRGDYRSLGERIVQLATESEMFLKMRANALKTVCRNYSFKQSIESYEDFYQRFLL